MVQLVNESLKGLDRSEITVTTYRRPRGFHLVVFTVVVLTVAAFYRRKNFQPGQSMLYDRLLVHVPGFANFCYAVQPLVISLMLLIHAFEASVMAWTRLRRHGVGFFTGLWWVWMVSCFIEGFGAFQRFDGIVERELEKRKTQKPTR